MLAIEHRLLHRVDVYPVVIGIHKNLKFLPPMHCRAGSLYLRRHLLKIIVFIQFSLLRLGLDVMLLSVEVDQASRGEVQEADFRISPHLKLLELCLKILSLTESCLVYNWQIGVWESVNLLS